MSRLLSFAATLCLALSPFTAALADVIPGPDLRGHSQGPDSNTVAGILLSLGAAVGVILWSRRK